MSLQLAEQFEANEQYEDAYREYKEVYEQNRTSQPEIPGVDDR